MEQIRFFRTHDGIKAVAEKELELLALFLTTDIGEDAALADEILSSCREVLAGKKTGWQMSGNGHSVDVELGTVHIESLFDPDAGSLNMQLPEFVQVLDAWQDFITNAGLLALRPLSY